jgi:rhamnulose-1-phosphate aldolase
MQTQPHPELDVLLTMMGEAGKHMTEIGASEGAAGNISVCVRWALDVHSRYPLEQEMELPQPVPELEGAAFLVSGSGRRLREIISAPEAHLGCIIVNPGGKTGTLCTSPARRFEKVTSEFNSHLAVHYDQVKARALSFHALIHAQPVHLTYLSQIPRYQDQATLNTHLLRWQPETILNIPEGIGVIPFCVPGSAELMNANVDAMRRHRIVLWAKHGVMARSDVSIKGAADKVEYAEAAARYEYLNLVAGEPAEGLSLDEIRSICTSFDIHQTIF